jgi:hypothetical protein
VKRLNALIGTLSTPTSAPMVAATRAAEGLSQLGPENGPAGHRHARHRETVGRNRAAGPADSAFYGQAWNPTGSVKLV